MPPIMSTPPLTVVGPLTVSAPVSVSVPEPAFVRLPSPEIALASVTSLPLVSKIAVWPLARAMNWLETSCVLPLAHCRVPPANVMPPVPSEPWANESVPPLSVVPPL